MNVNCQKIEPLLAGYALDALSRNEKLEVEAHIQICKSCQTALEDYLSISDGLLGAVLPIQPLARVRAGLLTKITSAEKSTGRSGNGGNNFSRWIVAVGYLAVFFLVFLNINLMRNSNQMIKDIQNLQQQNEAYQTAFVLFADPNARTLEIDQQDISGALVYDPDGHLAILNVQGLAELPEKQVYQIWLIEPDETRISGGLFSPSDEAGYVSFVINSPSSMSSFEDIGVTVEPEGGSPGPTGPRVFGLKL